MPMTYAAADKGSRVWVHFKGSQAQNVGSNRFRLSGRLKRRLSVVNTHQQGEPLSGALIKKKTVTTTAEKH